MTLAAFHRRCPECGTNPPTERDGFCDVCRPLYSDASGCNGDEIGDQQGLAVDEAHRAAKMNQSAGTDCAGVGNVFQAEEASAPIASGMPADAALVDFKNLPLGNGGEGGFHG